MTVSDIIFDLVLVVSCSALSLVIRDAFDRRRQVAVFDERLVTEFDFFFESLLLVFDEAVLFERLVALLFLLRGVIRFISDVTTFGVAVMTLDFLVVFRFLDRDHFVDATFASSGD